MNVVTVYHFIVVQKIAFSAVWKYRFDKIKPLNEKNSQTRNGTTPLRGRRCLLLKRTRRQASTARENRIGLANSVMFAADLKIH